MINKDCERIVVSEKEIAEAVERIGKQINTDYAGEEITFISILNGSYPFTADILRKIDLDCTVDFMQVSSYGGGTDSSGTLNIKRDISADIRGKHVILLEDILDTGFTLSNLVKYLAEKGPADIKICTFIDKPARRREEISADYYGFLFDEDLFLVGYGLDYNQKYRNLPYVAVLKPEIYTKTTD